MEGTSSTTLFNNTGLQLIRKRIKSLQKRYKRLKLKEESLAQGKSLNQQGIHAAKLRILIRIEELKKLLRAFSVSPQEQLSSYPNNTANAAICNEEKVAEVFRCCQQSGVLEELTNPQTSEAACTHACPFKKIPSLNETDQIINPAPPLDKERYLCVSDGFVVYCADLKSGKDGSDGLEVLPILSTIDFLEKDLPVSMGLFKLGSDVFMVSGQEFPGFKKHPDLDLPHWLYKKYGVKGSSRKAYHLSLADSRLSLSECNNFPLLNKAKFWPIVLKLGNQMHMIKSIPYYLPLPETIPSHEVLDLNDPHYGWTKLWYMRYPGKEDIFIRDPLVVGDQIYARTCQYTPRFAVFDSRINSWTWSEDSGEHSAYHVMEDDDLVSRICTGKFTNEESGEPLFVVIGIGDTIPSIPGSEHMEMIAVAYLVNGSGQVVCSQSLPHFFERIKERCFVREASLFSVDEEGETICSVVLVTFLDPGKDFLVISTFTVDLKPDLLYSDLLTQCDAYSDTKDFVNVVSKDWHVYEVGGPRGYPLRLSACFL